MKPIVYTTNEYAHVIDQLTKDADKSNDLSNHIVVGSLERKKFPDGERYVRILDDVNKKDVVIFGATHSDTALMEIIELSSACVKYGALSLKIIIPYFGYSTMERSVKSGEIVGAKIRARMLSMIPQASMGNKIYLLDLHSEGIPYYFENNTTVFHKYAKQAIVDMIKQTVPQDCEFVLGSTDAGRAKWVESLAKEMHVQPAFVYKQRTSGTETSITGVNADVKGKHVVIYDDMIRSGGSIIQAAGAYMKAGAKSISLVTTHGIFCSPDNKTPAQVIKNIMKKTQATSLCLTDSHPNSVELMMDNVYIYNVSKLFAKVILE